MSEPCPQCGKIHPKTEGTGVFAEKEERDSLQLIVNAVTNARQALDPRNIPPGTTQEQATLYVGANQRTLAGYQLLEKEWWENAQKRHPKTMKGSNITLNFGTGEFLKFRHE